MKSIKYSLMAILIPTAALPMERAKNALKKTAPAAAAVITVGFLGYKAAQAYGINPLHTAKNWLHADCKPVKTNEQERQAQSLTDLKANYEGAVTAQARRIAALEKEVQDARAGEANLKARAERLQKLEDEVVALREQNNQLSEQLRAKEVAAATVGHTAQTPHLPVVAHDLLQSIPSAPAAPQAQEIEDIKTFYKKALRADAINMASIFDIALRACTPELDSLMVHNRRYERIKELITNAQAATQAFLKEFKESDVNFQKSETVQRARSILGRYQYQINEIAENLGDLEIALINAIRANNNILMRGFSEPKNDQRYVEFRSFIDSFHSRQNQCRTHETYKI